MIRKAVASANLPEGIQMDIRDPEFRNRLINNNNNNLANENSENVEPIPQVPPKCSIMSMEEIKTEFEFKNETKTEYPLKCEPEIVSLKPDIKEEIKVEDIKKGSRDAPSPVESEHSSSVETISTDSNNGSECEDRAVKIIKPNTDFLKVTDEKRHFMEMCGLITHLKNASLQKTLYKRNTKSTKRDDYVYEKHVRELGQYLCPTSFGSFKVVVFVPQKMYFSNSKKLLVFSIRLFEYNFWKLFMENLFEIQF